MCYITQQILEKIAPPVLAQESNNVNSLNLGTSWIPTLATDLPLNDLIRRGLNIALIAVGIVATAFLIWMGIRYIIAGSDTTKAKEAQEGIKTVIIGTVVALAAFVIVQFIYQAMDARFVTDVTDIPTSETAEHNGSPATGPATN